MISFSSHLSPSSSGWGCWCVYTVMMSAVINWQVAVLWLNCWKYDNVLRWRVLCCHHFYVAEVMMTTIVLFILVPDYVMVETMVFGIMVVIANSLWTNRKEGDSGGGGYVRRLCLSSSLPEGEGVIMIILADTFVVAPTSHREVKVSPYVVGSVPFLYILAIIPHGYHTSVLRYHHRLVSFPMVTARPPSLRYRQFTFTFTSGI